MDAGPPIASSLEVRVAGQVGFVFHVTNNTGRRLELTFPSGQTHEFVVLDSGGHEVWRWSQGRFFTQAFQSRVLEPGGTLSWEAAMTPAPAPGRYAVVATLRSDDHPLERRVEFTVP